MAVSKRKREHQGKFVREFKKPLPLTDEERQVFVKASRKAMEMAREAGVHDIEPYTNPSILFGTPLLPKDAT